MPTRFALAAAAALLLAAIACCACAPVAVPPAHRRPAATPATPAHSRRAALAAFHLRDEGGLGPAEALRLLDEPRADAPKAEPDTLAQGEHSGLSQAEHGELALRAVALNQLGRYAEAVAALDKLMLARRDLPPAALADAFVERGLALGALGHQLRASEDYAAALAVAPRHIPALLARADQHFALGQAAEAEAGYSKVIDIAPGNILARVNRGVARDEQGRFGEAIDDFTQALRLDPRSPVALVNRGVSRSQAGDMAGMCADYLAACRLGACFRLQSARAMGYCRVEE